MAALLNLLNDNNYIGISTVTMKTLPKIGYMVLRNNHPVAAGFLRRVEGGYAQLDTLTSNPMFGSLIRHEAIQLVVNALLQDAKDLKCIGIIAFSIDKGILNRAKTMGFHTLDHKLIALKL